MARRDRKCYLCGETYKYCPTCSSDRTKPSWMAEFHSEDCVKIFSICTRFNMGALSKAEAQEALSTCDLSNKENFKSCIQRDFEVIFAEEPKKRGKRAEAKPIDDAMDIELEVAEPVVEDTTHEVVTTENE